MNRATKKRRPRNNGWDFLSLCLLIVISILSHMTPLLAQDGELIQVHEDFSIDPGWESINNRVIGEGGPMINQDFGWTPGDDGRGAVGGVIWSTHVPADYGMPIGQPFDLRRELSASGKVTIKNPDNKTSDRSGVYFGFYNSTYQSWRPWSSLLLEFGEVRAKFANKPISSDPQAVMNLNVLTAGWRSDGVGNDLRIPADGKPHAWSFLYEPDAKMADGTVRSLITLQVEGEEPFRGLLETPDMREHPAIMDRFGIVNMQAYGNSMEVYFSDLTINGHKVDLTKDPGWVGQGNRVSFPAAYTFHGHHDYGFMETNWAGEAPGEVGGLMWATEMPDPVWGYYADDIGMLTLDDPISFYGNVCIIDGQPDSGMMFGYFNTQALETEDFFQRLDQSMGLFVEGPSSIGKQLMIYCAINKNKDLVKILPEPPLFQPDRQRHQFAFDYDPKANGGVGRMTLTLDGKSYGLDLTPEQRKVGATFDRFGLRNMRGGGKLVDIYFDDLTYTVRRPKDYRPVHHKQEFVRVPYPEGGRRY
jgi:hypothetical protein